MAVRKRGGRWHYDFMIKTRRYRGVIPEARTKAQAEQAETRIRQDVYEDKYEKAKAPSFESFVKEEYLPWSKLNKRSWRSDVGHVETLVREFGEMDLDEITPVLIERFKRERWASVTRRGKDRAPASVNREEIVGANQRRARGLRAAEIAGSNQAVTGANRGADVARGGVNQGYQLDLQANRITYDGAVKAATQVRDASFEAAKLRALSTVVSAVGHNVARDMEQGLALRY